MLVSHPSLTFRAVESPKSKVQSPKQLRRIVLDSLARTPLKSKVVTDKFAALTTIVVSNRAPQNRVAALAKRVNVIIAPTATARRAYPRAGSSAVLPRQQIDLRRLLKQLGSENVTRLLVEGGGEVNASFLFGGFAHRVAFFYAPKVLGGRDSLKAVAGEGAKSLTEVIRLHEVEWNKIGGDLMMTASITS